MHSWAQLRTGIIAAKTVDTVWLESGAGYFGSVYRTSIADAGNWYADETVISGETGATYTMTADNEGKAISFRTAGYSSNKIKLFTPAALASVVHWFDAALASSITHSSGAVSAWASRVGSVSLQQGVAGSQPTYSATGRNSKPAISTDGTADHFTFSDSGASLPNNANTSTVATVAFFVNTASLGWRGLTYWGASSTTGRYLAKSSTERVALTSATAATDNISTITWQGADKVVIGEIAGAASKINIDGNATAVTKSATYNSGTTSSAYVFRTLSGQYWSGSLQDLIILNAALTGTERQQLEGYLAAKWGLQSLLPSDHPFKLAAPRIAA